MNASVPNYRDLPVAPDGLRSAWGVWGDDDQLGSVNRITDAVVSAAVREEVRTGRRISLSLPINQPDPPFFGRRVPRHQISAMASGAQDDVLDDFFPQGSTQWDGLRHRGAAGGFWGGVTAAEAASPVGPLGIGAWAERGIITRGVLADVSHSVRQDGSPWSPFEPEVIDVPMLKRVLAKQESELRPGDVLIVRTGYLELYNASPLSERVRINGSGAAAGLSADESMAEFLWDSQLSGIATDTPALEVAPRDRDRPSLHARLLPHLGFAIGELFRVDDLARACAADKRWTFLFISIPLNLPAGVGSPTNAIAVQ